MNKKRCLVRFIWCYIVLNLKQKKMEKCKWNFRILGYYVRLTESNRFIILGKREEQWVEVVGFNWL